MAISPLPLPGMVLTAGMLSRPYRTWGRIAAGSGSGTSFAATTPTQFTTPNFQAYSDRFYMLHAQMFWRCSAADNTVEWDVQGDPGTAVFASIRASRQTGPVANGSFPTDTLETWIPWGPGVDTSAARFRLVGTRLGGAGTFTPGTYIWDIFDIGPI